jgi:hypothetical protein
MAGLFDGEGSVGYAQRWVKDHKTKKTYFCWNINCAMSLTDYKILKWFQQTLGFGGVWTKKVPEGLKPQWRWACCFHDSYKFAKQMLPYTKIKYEKLKQIIDHYDESRRTH